MSFRVRVSRAICHRLFRGDTMLCTRAELYRHPIRHLLNLAFRWRERDHCDASLRWEARQEREADALDWLRRAGLL